MSLSDRQPAEGFGGRIEEIHRLRFISEHTSEGNVRADRNLSAL
jgi:hypothetical protein